MAKLRLRKLDPVDYLESEKDLALYLEACLQEGGDAAAFLAAALGDVARARGKIGELADSTGMTRAGLYEALSKEGNPSFAAVLKVIRAMGLEIRIVPQR